MINLLIEFTLFLTVPSLGQIQKYLGTHTAFIYPIIIFIILLIAYKYRPKKILVSISERRVCLIALFLFVVLLSIFSFVYPFLNAGIVGGGGDRDDDLNISCRALLNGDYPYYQTTYLGNPLSHLPGSIILAIPFVILGNSAYQNFFWLFIFFVFLWYYLRSSRKALFIILIILMFSPAVLQEILTGGDLVTNSIYILIFTLMLINSAVRKDLSAWQKITWAIFLGIALSSRWNFILLLPLIFSLLLQKSNLKTAIKYTAISLSAFFSISLPFYLYDPNNFTPLTNSFNKINIFGQILPHSGLFIVLSSGLFSVLFSLQAMDKSRSVFLRNCALVQVFPVFCLVILDSLRMQGVNFNFASYGLSFLFFASLYAADKIWKFN